MMMASCKKIDNPVCNALKPDNYATVGGSSAKELLFIHIFLLITFLQSSI